jgi:hypothetical protein
MEALPWRTNHRRPLLAIDRQNVGVMGFSVLTVGYPEG